ncbi:hypothetical protein HDU76_004356 [Blyttiomyces sp. JEL0837]|nr:hypothetical protein HDU76_004356 [Blyttiomyces sp. JEL0837]
MITTSTGAKITIWESNEKKHLNIGFNELYNGLKAAEIATLKNKRKNARKELTRIIEAALLVSEKRILDRSRVDVQRMVEEGYYSALKMSKNLGLTEVAYQENAESSKSLSEQHNAFQDKMELMKRKYGLDIGATVPARKLNHPPTPPLPEPRDRDNAKRPRESSPSSEQGRVVKPRVEPQRKNASSQSFITGSNMVPIASSNKREHEVTSREGSTSSGRVRAGLQSVDGDDRRRKSYNSITLKTTTAAGLFHQRPGPVPSFVMDDEYIWDSLPILKSREFWKKAQIWALTPHQPSISINDIGVVDDAYGAYNSTAKHVIEENGNDEYVMSDDQQSEVYSDHQRLLGFDSVEDEYDKEHEDILKSMVITTSSENPPSTEYETEYGMPPQDSNHLMPSRHYIPRERHGRQKQSSFRNPKLSHGHPYHNPKLKLHKPNISSNASTRPYTRPIIFSWCIIDRILNRCIETCTDLIDINSIVSSQNDNNTTTIQENNRKRGRKMLMSVIPEVIEISKMRLVHGMALIISQFGVQKEIHRAARKGYNAALELAMRLGMHINADKDDEDLSVKGMRAQHEAMVAKLESVKLK